LAANGKLVPLSAGEASIAARWLSMFLIVISWFARLKAPPIAVPTNPDAALQPPVPNAFRFAALSSSEPLLSSIACLAATD